MRLAIALMACTALPAADLFSELALSGPREEGWSGPGGADLGGYLLAGTSTHRRLDGVALVRRDADDPDAQAVASLCWNDVGNRRFSLLRLAAHGGTDARAPQPGRGFGGVQVMWSAREFISASCDAGWSADRGAVVAVEGCWWFLRVRGERDDMQRSVRLGTGPRFVGSDAPWAGAVLVDYVIGATDDHTRLDGGQVTAWIARRLPGRLLLAGEIQAASNVRGADDRNGPAATASVSLGVDW